MTDSRIVSAFALFVAGFLAWSCRGPQNVVDAKTEDQSEN